MTATVTQTEVSERPILFSGEMVRAILAGHKTQTRRIVKWQPYQGQPVLNWTASSMDLGYAFTGMPSSGHVLYSRDGNGCWNQRTKPEFCTFGQPGDRLWVRETWQPFFADGYIYLADAGTGRLNASSAEHAKKRWP